MPKSKQSSATSIQCVSRCNLAAQKLSKRDQAWAETNGFSGRCGQLLRMPDENGLTASYLFGIGDKGSNELVTGLAAQSLEPGNYQLVGDLDDPDRLALGFLLGSYRFDKYRQDSGDITLEDVAGADMAEAHNLKQAAFIARDLINSPPNDLGPDALETEIRAVASKHKADVKVTKGNDLLTENFPMVHAVGRASTQEPRLVEFSWGTKSHPKVTLVGKGVTFDTGGLDIKPPAGMLIMKKDMGGAANILGLAHAIMAAKMKIRLRVIIPVVENAIAGNAFRPGDILPSRSGFNVEIGNTDAEGRLILADALTLASEDDPELIFDMATLTGAARVALGPELPPLYSNNSELAGELVAAGLEHDDPVWHMPLWQPYDRMLASKIADVNHISAGGFAGSITAALFLQRFVRPQHDWVHLDIFGWAPEPRRARSFGGTDQGIRAIYAVLKQRFG